MWVPNVKLIPKCLVTMGENAKLSWMKNVWKIPATLLLGLKFWYFVQWIVCNFCLVINGICHGCLVQLRFSWSCYKIGSLSSITWPSSLLANLKISSKLIQETMDYLKDLLFCERWSLQELASKDLCLLLVLEVYLEPFCTIFHHLPFSP